MLDPDLIERIRTIFLHTRSFVSIDDAAALLGWSPEQMREAIERQDVDLTTTCSGKVVPCDELVAFVTRTLVARITLLANPSFSFCFAHGPPITQLHAA